MKKPTRWMAGLLLAMASAPLLAFAAYDLLEFQPHRAAIDRIVGQAAPDERRPPASIQRLLAIAVSGDDARYCARLLLEHADDAPKPLSARRESWRATLWKWLAQLHLSPQARATIILTLAPTGHARSGVAATASAMYGRPPSALSLDEAATVIALVITPGAEDDPTLLSTLKTVLLLRYVSG